MKNPLLIVVVSFIFWFLLFEGIGSYWLERTGDPLDKAKKVLQADGNIGWHQRPNFRGKFLGIPLMTNELGLRSGSLTEARQATKKIIILGPSSTFGWGVRREQTYADKLQKNLYQKYPGISIKVINAGQIGFSSWQGRKFYQQSSLAGLDPDLLIIAYGVNDIDRYRFFFNSPLPDKTEFLTPKPTGTVQLQNFLNNFNSISLLVRRINLILWQWRSGMNDYIQNDNDPVPKLRVNIADFKENLRALIKTGRNKKAAVIILSTGAQLPEFIKKPALDNKIKKLNDLARLEYAQGRHPNAIVFFENSLKQNPDQNETYYYLSACYAKLGNRQKSQENFQKARAHEPQRIARDLQKINRAVLEIGSEEKVIISDIAKYLDPAPQKGLYVDPIHPSDAGHTLIAKDLTRLILANDLLKLAERYK